MLDVTRIQDAKELGIRSIFFPCYVIMHYFFFQFRRKVNDQTNKKSTEESIGFIN